MTDSQNPYEVLPDAELPAAAEASSTSPLAAIEPTGTFLALKSGETLPKRCVYTNQPATDDDLIHRTLTWGGKSFRPSRGVRKCEIRYYVSPRIRRAKKLRTQLMLLGIIPSLACTIWFQSWLLLAITFAIPHVIEKFISARIGTAPPLTLTDFRDDRFWLHGCCTEFLLQLREELSL